MFRPGDVLRKRYRIESFLGRGGMADVYLALDLRRQVQVAIKVLREDLAEDPEFINRFRREAQALARLDHPYIVRFYSFERQGSTAFIVMDYVEGQTLRKYLLEAGGPLPLEEVTRILHQVGSALQYAHNEGYIHRDIKPGNILIRKDGTALLSDFGIARAAETATMTMGPIGAPAYMSPEQIRGEDLTTRSDIYSLGIVLYEMVTGRRPFTGEGATGTGSMSRLKRIQQQQLREQPPDPRRFNPQLPERAVRVIERTLAKRPEERWPDVMSLVRAWEDAVGSGHARFVEGRILSPTAPLPPAAAAEPPMWKRGPWVAVIAVAVVAVIALLIFGIALAKPKEHASTALESPQPVAMVTATPQETPTPMPDIGAAAKATAEAILTATAQVEQEIETVVAMTAEAFEATVTQQALEAAQTVTVAAKMTATSQAKAAEATAAAQIRLTATKRAKMTATARTQKTKPTPTPKPKPKKKSSSSGGGVKCFEARRRHWEQSPAGGGEIAGIVYDINGRPFNRAQVHLYIKASNWETYLPIAGDGIYHFCCLAYSMQNLHVVELTGPSIRTIKTYEFYINNPNLNKVLVDFYQVPCR